MRRDDFFKIEKGCSAAKKNNKAYSHSPSASLRSFANAHKKISASQN